MGYTHYWRLKPTILPTEAVLVLGELLWHAYTRGVVQYEFGDPQPPLVSDTEIRFNGVGEQGHETFHFLAPAVGRPDSVRTFQFCKTARKPYDQVVMQVLIVLKHYLGDAISVTSDGDFEVEWADARREIEHRYGIKTTDGEQLERVAG